MEESEQVVELLTKIATGIEALLERSEPDHVEQTDPVGTGGPNPFDGGEWEDGDLSLMFWRMNQAEEQLKQVDNLTQDFGLLLDTVVDMSLQIKERWVSFKDPKA